MHWKRSTVGAKLIPLGHFMALILLTASSYSDDKEFDFAGQANSSIEVHKAITDAALGAVQGVVMRGGKVYAYGDVKSAQPRLGVIIEYDTQLRPTGRIIRLTKNGTPLILHPTGLTWSDRWGTILGDTVNKKAVIYRLDWDRAWQDGTLDSAVIATCDDDAAINGCRPLFVKLDGRSLLATADYGDVHPEIRLYDPAELVKHGRSSAPGVVVHRVLCGPFNQNLSWDDAHGTLTCVQNVIEGKGGRLDRLDLKKAVADGRADGPGVRTSTLRFSFSEELEGFWPINAQQSIFAVAARRDNLIIGTVHPSSAKPTN